MKHLKVKTEQDKVIELVAWILNLKKEDEEKVAVLIKELGVRTFFLNIENLDLSKEVKGKLFDLRNVIEAFDGDIEDVDFGEGGDQ